MSHDYLNLIVIAGSGLIGVAIANVIMFLVEMRALELNKKITRNYGPLVLRLQLSISLMLIAYGILGISQR